MSPSEFAEIKKKAASLKETISRDEGAKDQLLQQIKTLLKNPQATLEDAEAYLVKLREQKERLTKKWDTATQRLETLTNWSEI
jgi:hypothetical protein